jgi:HAD superfamily hydrolase (TIGR01490 family)
MNEDTRIPAHFTHPGSASNGTPVACFDVDRTLVARTSMERQFVRWLIQHREIGVKDLLWTAFAIGSSVGASRRRGYFEYHGYLAGRSVDDVAVWAERCLSDRIVSRVPSSAIGEINGHRADGRTVILLSGSILPLVAALGERVGADVVVASVPEAIGGVFTGRLSSEHLAGPQKAIRVQAIAAERGYDLTQSYGYADHFTDEGFLACFGHPRPTNPDRKLRAIASARGWPIVRFR